MEYRASSNKEHFRDRRKRKKPGTGTAGAAVDSPIPRSRGGRPETHVTFEQPDAFQRISIGTCTGPAGTFRQSTGIPKTAHDLTTLYVGAPGKIHDIGLLCRAWRVCYRPEQVAAAHDDSSPVRRQYPA